MLNKIKNNTNIIKDPIIVSFFAVSILLLIISVLIGGSKFAEVSGQLILNVYASGEPLLGGFSNILYVWGILSMVIIINLILAHETYNRDRFISYIFSASGLLASVFIFIAILMIGGLN